MNGFVVAAIAMLVLTIPSWIVILRGSALEALVAYEALGAMSVMILVLLAEGFWRSGEFELPVLFAVLIYGSGLVFVRFFERGLARCE